MCSFFSSMPAAHEHFRAFAHRAAELVGSAGAFIVAVVLLVGWGLTGPIFNFSDTWQLLINTTTTIVTFLIVFLIQNTQNRDARAMHLKLDELIRVHRRARNSMIDLSKLSDVQLRALEAEYSRIRDDEDEEDDEDDQAA